MKHEHTTEAIEERLREGPAHRYLRDWVYGGIDGAVTTFAIVSGVVGAHLGHKTIIILGVANLLADGLSMAASNFLGTKTEHDEWALLERHERQQIDQNHAGEKEEVRVIMQRKGFKGHALEDAVEIITQDHDRWIEVMMLEEYGLSRHIRSPIKAGLSTFLSFFFCGALPLLAYFFGMEHAFIISCVLTGLAFFGVGSLKSKWSVTKWWVSGTESFLIGGVAAGASYFVGLLLKDIV